MAQLTDTDIREQVRERYAAAAKQASGCGCGTEKADFFGGSLYDEASREQVPAQAVDASLGCGVPTAVADLSDGEVVLDLGSGGGADVLISARRVAPSGRAIGLDMTDEMLELARANAREAGVENVEFVKGYIERIPLPDASVDVVISNCVINLSGDKAAGKVCVCELVPLFELSQPTVSHHLKVLRQAGIVDSERRGLWAYYYVVPDALKELTAWLS